MKTPDIQAIRRIPALDVGLALNIIHQQVKQLTPGRWAFVGSSDATYLQFYRDGSYQDHKRECGGSCIDLVMQSCAKDHEHYQRYFMDACTRIAEEYNLFETTEELRKVSFTLAKKTAKANNNSGSYLLDGLRAIAGYEDGHAIKGNWDESINHIDGFLSLLDLSRDTVTWAATPSKQASIGFVPAVPWQGSRVFSKIAKDGSVSPFGGWTQERANTHVDNAKSLRIFCVDVDGEGKQLARLDLLNRLTYNLKKIGLPTRCIVFSSWNETRSSKETDRVKAHLYFVAKERAKDAAQFKRWHQVIEAKIASIINRWNDLPDDEIAALKRDHATHNHSRIMRVPGIAKYGRDHGAVLYSADKQALVDLADIEETVDVNITYANKEFTFGDACYVTVTKEDKDGETKKTTIRFGSKIWPLLNYRRVEDGESGVIYRYETQQGDVEYRTMAADAFNNKNTGKSACADAQGKGVCLRPETDHTFANALGYWSYVSHGRSVKLVRKSGWHQDKKSKHRVYVNGESVYGADNWEVDRDSEEVRRRSSRKGTLQEWRSGVQSADNADGYKGADDLIKTYGVGFLLGQSLAGPLIEILDLTPFTIHICGDTSHGKSTCARFAASVWGHPKYTFQSWDATPTGIEIAAETMNGACLVLDELKRFGNDRDKLSKLVYGLNSTQGRLKATAKSEPAQQRSWRLTTISTGEYSLYQFMGDEMYGGHGVRFLDVPTRIGDLTLNKQHAKDLDRLSYEQYGVVGDSWINFLTSSEDVGEKVWSTYRQWLDITNEWTDNNELLRIADNIAVIGTALTLASEAGILSWHNQTIESILQWAFGLIAPEDRAGGSNPSERAVSSLHRWFLTRPERFPKSNDLRGARKIIGFKERDFRSIEADNGEKGWEPIGPPLVYTCLWMLDKSDFALQHGISKPKTWLKWCVDNGYAERRNHETLAGGQRERWYVFRMEDLDAEDEITPKADASAGVPNKNYADASKQQTQMEFE